MTSVPDLAGKHVLITGAARGIGRACAIEFAKLGASLVLVDIAADKPNVPYALGTKGQLDYTAELCLEHTSSVLKFHADLTTESSVWQLKEKLSMSGWDINVLVNNAGIVSPSGSLVHEITLDQWQVMLDTNLTACWRLIKAFSPEMIKRRSGSIVNVSSTAGLVGYRYFSSYTTSKHGLIGLTKAAALDLAPYQIRVNAVCPGSVRDDALLEGAMLSEINRVLGLEGHDIESLYLQQQPMNSLVEATDVANMIVWLCKDDAKRITGTAIPVDAGYSIK